MEKVALGLVALSLVVFSFPALEPIANRLSLNDPVEKTTGQAPREVWYFGPQHIEDARQNIDTGNREALDQGDANGPFIVIHELKSLG